MALPVNGSTHLIPVLLLIYRPRKDERLSWPSWLTCSGWFTHISGHPSAADRAQDTESSPETDVLPLCYATDFNIPNNFRSIFKTFCRRQSGVVANAVHIARPDATRRNRRIQCITD